MIVRIALAVVMLYVIFGMFPHFSIFNLAIGILLWFGAFYYLDILWRPSYKLHSSRELCKSRKNYQATTG